VKPSRFVLSCHSVGTSLPEIALSAWMSASSFAGSLRYAFTLTRNVAAPVVVLFQSSSIASSKMSVSGAPTNFVCLHVPIFLQLSAALGCRTNESWVLLQGCRVMPRQRPPIPGRFELDPSSLRSEAVTF